MAAALAAAAAGHPSGQSKDQSPRPRFGTSTAAVSVDVVVRDKKGRPVTDLAESDFEVYEDGVRQKIVSFDRVVPSAVPEGPAAAVAQAPKAGEVQGPPVSAPPPQPVPGQAAVALVFDWLSDQPRHEAWKAARTLLQDMQPGDYAAVFSIDHSLQRLVPFTNDTASLDRAFAMALERPRPGSSRQNGSLVNGLASRPENSPTLAAEDGGVPASAVPAADPNARDGTADLAAMLERMDAFDAYVDQEQQAWAGVDALRGLVEEMGLLYGRKTVVLFSEGLSITNSTISAWHRLEDAANRLNVSFNTFDAHGLRVQSQQAAMGRRLPSASGSGVPGAMTFSAGQNADRTETMLGALLAGSTAGLAELASATGGRYISDTNDLTTRFHEVNTDRRYYYLLGYSSTNPALDGSFRRIEVKVRRSGVTVRSRSGYLAVPTVERTDRRDYEQPALAALAASPPPLAFPLRVRAISTPMPGRAGMTSLLAAIDSGSLTFEKDEDTARYEGQVTVVARIVSTEGAVATTRSEHYNLTGDLSHLHQARSGNILFFAAPDVPPGPHTVEWVVRDDQGARSSVARSRLSVPEGVRPIVGDLFIVSHTERGPKNKAVDGNPLAWKGLLLYPSFGEPISRSRQQDVSFALPMVVSPRGDPPTASLELMAGDRGVATLTFELGSARKDGRLMALGRLPLSSIPPGSYTLRVVVSSGERREIRSMAFSVVK
jgi:VWFA-related protein